MMTTLSWSGTYFRNQAVSMSRNYQLFFTFAYKEGLGFAPLQSADNTYSEFLKNVSRGKFSYPPVYLFDFCEKKDAAIKYFCKPTKLYTRVLIIDLKM